MINFNICFFFVFVFRDVESGAQGRGNILREFSFGRVEIVFLYKINILSIIYII